MFSEAEVLLCREWGCLLLDGTSHFTHVPRGHHRHVGGALTTLNKIPLQQNALLHVQLPRAEHAVKPMSVSRLDSLNRSHLCRLA